MFQLWIGVGEVVEIGQPKLISDSNTQVLQFKLYIRESFNNVYTETTHNISIWGKNVPLFLTSIHVGDIIDVRGVVKNRRWITQSGEERWSTYIQGNTIKKLDYKLALDEDAPTTLKGVV